MKLEDPGFQNEAVWNNKENEQYLQDSIRSLREYSENEDGNGAFSAFISSDAYQGSEADAAKEAVDQRRRRLKSLQDAARSVADCMEEIGTAFMERMPEKENAVISGEVLTELRTELSEKAESYSESAGIIKEVAEFLNSSLKSFGQFTVPDAEEAVNAFDELCGCRDAGERSIIGKTEKRLNEFLAYAEDIYRKYDPESLLDSLEQRRTANSAAHGGQESTVALSEKNVDAGDSGYSDWLRVIFDIGIPDESVAVGALSLD
ncbi:hypothetical protein SAMN06296386_11375 [Lachnospiraceae bacterium]|nr:hypothetical protein SAMN06296386_11375 [Lachnospiraceae bacterium]